MSIDAANMRISYERSALDKVDLEANPLDMFKQWMADAVEIGILEPNAMTLATVSADGTPSARMVLLKGVDHGFRFFTNYESAKAQDLAVNAQAALVFYWDQLHRSVRIVGTVEKLTAEASLAYYHSRPRGSQIGAWTSPQSTILDNREVLEAREREMVARFSDSAEIPLPPFWGGYRVNPRTIEFWQGRKSRLHDRFRYTQINTGGWQVDRLAP
ncbi:MAG: pyridoxamine 5'-phosphate oxidase [Candidatus Promineifilaceae bacterium]